MPGLYEAVTVGEVICSALRRFPERIAFRQDGRELSYRHVEETLRRWVAVLRERGRGRGQGVGLLSPNRPEAWMVTAAVALAGGRYTALHPLGSLDDHLHACNEAELKFLFVDPPFAERATQLLERADSLEALFSLGPSAAGEDITGLAEAVPVGGRLGRGVHGPEDLAYLLYTGGTTGVPKAAMLSERAFSTLAHGTALGWDLPGEMRYLAVAPISHAAGMLILPTLMRAGPVT